MAPTPQQESKPETFRNPAMEDQDEFSHALTKGRMLARIGNIDEAVAEFKRAASLKNGQCAECFQLIGQACFVSRKYKEAVDAYRQAIALKPENEGDLNNALGVCLYLENDKKVLEDAVAAFNRALDLTGGKLVKIYYNLGYALLKLGKEAEGKAALTRYLELDPKTPNETEVRAVIANPKMMNEKFAPGFRVKSSTGDELSLDKYRGKIVLLDFWASWCGPCREEMPNVKNMWAKFGGEQFVIVGISLDHTEKAFENYVKRENLTWPQFFDEQGQLAQLYGVNGIPHTVLIDQDGIIRAVGFRGNGLSGKIEDLLKKLRKQTASNGRS